MRAACLHELRGLGNVFAKDEFWLELVVETCLAKDGNSSAAVWSVVRIRDGYFLDARVQKSLQTRGRVERRVWREPKDEVPHGIDLERRYLRQSRDSQLVRVVDVGGKKKVEWRAVLDLGDEVAAGAVGDGEFCASLFFVLGGEIGKDELEIGSGGDADGLGANGGRKK